jgi:hypothetical protein
MKSKKPIKNVERTEDTGPWIKTVRRENGIIEHICKHGVGHPAMGSVDFMTQVNGDNAYGIHGCDGCCSDPEWKLADAQNGCRIANRYIINLMKLFDVPAKRVDKLVNSLDKLVTAMRRIKKRRK